MRYIRINQLQEGDLCFFIGMPCFVVNVIRGEKPVVHCLRQGTIITIHGDVGGITKIRIINGLHVL